MIRRDRLYREDGKLDSAVVARDEFVGGAAAMLEAIQSALHAQATTRLRANIVPVERLGGGRGDASRDGQKNPGWVDVAWSKPTGAALDAVVERLKALKLTIRNAPHGPDRPARRRRASSPASPRSSGC